MLTQDLALPSIFSAKKGTERMEKDVIVVGDLGKTQLRLGEATGHRLVAVEKLPTPDASPTFWEEIAEHVFDYASVRHPAAVKLAVAGAVRGGEVASPRVRTTYPLGPVLSERLGVPVTVANDLQAVAQGELHEGAARGVRDALLVTVSTGLGAAVIKGGTVLPQPARLTDEYGHRELPERLRDPAIGVDAGCGRICYESHAAGESVYERARARGMVFRENRDFDRLAAKGDHRALELYEEEGHILGEWLAEILLERPLPLVVWQGTFARRGFEFFEWPLRERLSELVGKIPEFRQGELGDEAGLIGATYLR